MAEAPSASDAGERWLLPSLRSCANGSQGSEWRRWLGRGLRLSDVDAGPRLAVAGALSLTPAQVPWVRALAQQDLPDELKGKTETAGEASLRGHLTNEGAPEEKSGSSAYVPRDAKDDKQLNYALDLLRGKQQHANFPPDPNKAIPN